MTNPRGVRFDDVYNAENDEYNDPALARAVYIAVRRQSPNRLKPLID